MVKESSTKTVMPVYVDTNKIGCGLEKRVKGIPVSPGVGLGRPCYYHNQILEHPNEYENDSSVQPPLLKSAFKQLQDQLNFLAAKAESVLDSQTADIFRAHRMVCDEIQINILQTNNRDQFISTDYLEKSFNDYTAYFNGLTDDYLRKRWSLMKPDRISMEERRYEALASVVKDSVDGFLYGAGDNL